MYTHTCECIHIQDLASEEMRTWVAEALATSKEYLILYAPRGDATIKQSSFSISSSSTSRRCVHTHVHTRMLVHMPMHIRAYRDCICSRARAHTHTHTRCGIILFQRCEKLLEKLRVDHYSESQSLLM